MTDKQPGQQSPLPNQSPKGSRNSTQGYLSCEQLIDDLQALLIEEGMSKPDLAESLSINIEYLDSILSVTGLLKHKLVPKVLRLKARGLRKRRCIDNCQNRSNKDSDD